MKRFPVSPAAGALVLACALFTAACSQGKPPSAAAAATPVATAVATAGPDHPALVLHGAVGARDELRLGFKVGGVVARIAVEAGDAVHAGEVLAELEPAEVDSLRQQAHELDARAARDLERGEKLYADEVISLEQLQNLRTQRAVAAAQLASAQFNQEHARIVAGAAGVVLLRLVNARELVAPGQPVLVVSSGTRGYVLRTAVADRELLQLSAGLAARVTLDAAPDTALDGRVSLVSRAADPATGLFPVEIALEPAGLRLASGMVASARLQPDGGARLARIPVGALVTGNGEHGIVFVLEGGHARRREVQVAFIDGDELALRAGIRPGEVVITDGAPYIDDGERVAVGTTGARAGH